MNYCIEEDIRRLIGQDVNPALSSHNGYVELVGISLKNASWEVELNFLGGCLGCPASMGKTLRAIELLFREELSAPTLTVKNSVEV